jgi:acyl dehydratase
MGWRAVLENRGLEFQVYSFTKKRGEGMELANSAVGSEFSPDLFEVTAESIKAYARAYNEDNPAFLDDSRPGGIIAPPLYGVVFSIVGMAKPIGLPGLGFKPEDVLRMVHGGQDMRFLGIVRPGDKLETRSWLDSVSKVSTGETYTVKTMSTNQRGEPVLETFCTIFFREPGKGTARGDQPVAPPGKLILEKIQRMDPDQALRYAEASGDYNPIHTSDEIARMAGLPGVIVHGLCTMAFTSKVICDGLAGGDSTRIKRLKVRFSKPVLPGQEITTRVWELEKRGPTTTYAYETRNQDGLAVIREGIAEID